MPAHSCALCPLPCWALRPGARAVPGREVAIGAMGWAGVFILAGFSVDVPCPQASSMPGKWHRGTAATAEKCPCGSGGKLQALLFGASPSVPSPWEAFVTLNVARNSTKQLLDLSGMPWDAQAPSMANS